MRSPLRVFILLSYIALHSHMRAVFLNIFVFNCNVGKLHI